MEEEATKQSFLGARGPLLKNGSSCLPDTAPALMMSYLKTANTWEIPPCPVRL